MSRPEQLPRRSSRKAAAGRQAVLLTASALAAGVLGFGLWREAQNPRFAVHIVAIRGLGHTQAAEVVGAAGLPAGENAWLINRAAVERRIEALPWVGKVSLHIGWPNRLTIALVERQPAARVALGVSGGEEPVPRYALIDDTQRVLSVGDDPKEYGQLPVLVVAPPPSSDALAGSDLERREVGQALDAYRRLSALGLRVSEVAIAPSTGISATADRNLRVLFGEDEDLAKKAQLFEAIVAKISTPSRIAYVDVRSVRAPTVLYR